MSRLPSRSMAFRGPEAGRDEAVSGRPAVHGRAPLGVPMTCPLPEKWRSVSRCYIQEHSRGIDETEWAVAINGKIGWNCPWDSAGKEMLIRC